ncbi:5,10-methylene tetrahydromethanopterin reductase [Solibacillus sp. FSL R5-0449]|uniref:5,10-methylene tetrahydromethanopterin reductase n=1 Tax=Solibacillus sp. FSL R5-0449 TaxID=2921639 RepID=UPI0030CE6A3C
MKRWSITTLLIIVLTLLPISQIEWNTEAEASQTSKVNNEVILKSASPNKAVKEKTPVSNTGFMPKVNRTYTYKPSFEDAGPKTYTASQNESIENSVELLEGDYIGYTYIEDEQQLALGVAYSDLFFFSLSYPMKEKTTITDTDYLYDGTTETTQVYVESTSATVKTKAGTFQNVVVLKYPNGMKLYLAKDYGIIRITDFEGTITTELISVK